MVGKSVTGALVSGAVLAAPAAAETSLRRLGVIGATYDNPTPADLTFTSLPADLDTTQDIDDQIRTALAAALALSEHGLVKASSQNEISLSDFADIGAGVITAVEGNTISITYTPIFATVDYDDFDALESLLTANGTNRERFLMQVADKFAQVGANASAGYRAVKVFAANEDPALVSGTVHLNLDMPENFAANTDDFLTAAGTKIKESLDLTDMGIDTVTATHTVVADGIKLDFEIDPDSAAFANPSKARDERYHNLELTLGTAEAKTGAEQDLRDAFRLKVVCRLKSGNHLPEGVTWKDSAPSDNVCNEILGITADPDNDDDDGSSEESTDESSSARSVAVVSFLSTAAAAAALF